MLVNVAHDARLSQADDSGRAVVEARPRSEGAETNAAASAWLADLFNELVLDLDGCRLSGEIPLALLLLRTGGNPIGENSDADVVVRCENAVIHPRAAVGLRLAKIVGAPVNPVTLTPGQCLGS